MFITFRSVFRSFRFNVRGGLEVDERRLQHARSHTTKDARLLIEGCICMYAQEDPEFVVSEAVKEEKECEAR